MVCNNIMTWVLEMEGGCIQPWNCVKKKDSKVSLIQQMIHSTDGEEVGKEISFLPS